MLDRARHVVACMETSKKWHGLLNEGAQEFLDVMEKEGISPSDSMSFFLGPLVNIMCDMAATALKEEGKEEFLGLIFGAIRSTLDQSIKQHQEFKE